VEFSLLLKLFDNLPTHLPSINTAFSLETWKYKRVPTSNGVPTLNAQLSLAQIPIKKQVNAQSAQQRSAINVIGRLILGAAAKEHLGSKFRTGKMHQIFKNAKSAMA
jgi:hypothetical protein